MRYYKITITPPSGSSNSFAPIVFTTKNNTNSTALTGFDNGAALKVELDVFQNWFHQSSQNGFVRIYGVSFADLNQATNLNPIGTSFCGIQIEVGMSKGLPYANPSQAGLIINGSILQAFGNWQGTEVSLDLVVGPSNYSPNEEVNLSFNWKKGTTLQQAVEQCIRNEKSYQSIPINGSFSSDLVFTEDQPAQYVNLAQLSKYVNDISKKIIQKDTYLGASIAATSAGFLLYDGTTSTAKTKTIEFTDIVGNLTWIGTYILQAKLIMRSDLNIGDKIIFPKQVPVINTAAGYSPLRSKIAFQGSFTINQVHHVGSSRQATGDDWVTIVDCIVEGVQ